MAFSIPSDCRKFRAAVAPMTTFIFVGGMVILFIFIVIRDGFHFDQRVLAFVTGFALMFSIIYSFVLSLVFPAAFSLDGIYGHSFWGRRRFVRWQDISSVRKFRLVSLRWLRVYSTDERVIWLALFQSHGTEFRQEIRRLAPPSNPVLSHV
jgi:hypothetical protein